MIIPTSFDDDFDKDLIDWLNDKKNRNGLTRSAFIRMKLNEIRLGELVKVDIKSDKPEVTATFIPTINTPTNKYANGFLKNIK